MKKLLICLLPILLLSGCTKTDEEKIADLYNDGLTHLEEFQYSKADSTFKMIYDINPTSIEGLFGQCLVNESRLLYFDAISDYMLIISKTADYPEAYHGLYRSYRNLGYYEEAIDAAIISYKQFKNDPEFVFELAESNCNVGENGRAIQLVKEAIDKGYSNISAAHYFKASLFYKEGQFDSSSTYAQKAEQNKENNAEYLNRAAEYFETIGSIDSSISYSKKLFVLDKSNSNNLFAHFSRALRNDYLFEARQVIQYLESQKVEPLVLEGYKLFYALYIDDKSSIRTHGQNFLNYSPGTLSGTVYETISRGEISDKLTLMQNTELVFGNAARGAYSDEFGSFYIYTMVRLYSKYDKSPTSLPWLEEYTGIRKNRMEVKLDIALTKHIIGQFDESYKALKILRKGHLNHTGWLTGIGDVWGHYAIRKYKNAERLYQEALTVNPYYLPAFESYLKILLTQKKYKEALLLYETYPQFEKNYNSVSLEKTKQFFLADKFDNGVKQLQQYFPTAVGNIVFIEELIDILAAKNRILEIASLHSILDTQAADNPDALILLSKLEHDAGNFDRSLEYINNAIAIETNNPEANILLARSYYYNGQKTKAYDLFEENLVRFNRNPRNLLYYSALLAEESIDFNKAANLARQAAFEGYATYEYVMNLSDIYYKMGRYDLARGEANKTKSFSNNSPFPYFRIGMSFYMEGKTDQNEIIKNNLNKAISLGLSGDDLKEAQDVLNKL